MTIKSNNNNLNYLTDPTFINVNRLFVLLFERDNAGDYRDSFQIIIYQTLKLKDFNVLIDGKSFFDLPVKNEDEVYKKIIEMSNNNDYTTGKLIDFANFKENYNLIAIHLSKQTKLRDPEQINFIEKLENQVHRATMFFIIEKSEEKTFSFLQNFVTIM